mmetsp:Transcript_42208/g.106300  ORF Transcript_42208/g.106300 Transcript_42208/m.106300 type:complete len:310 (-) Transcript_42208:1457-2386(-)
MRRSARLALRRRIGLQFLPGSALAALQLHRCNLAFNVRETLVSELHEGFQTRENQLVLVHEQLDIQAFRLILETHAPLDKLINSDVICAVRVQDLEQCMSLGDIKLQRLEVRFHSVVPQVCLELLPRKPSRFVCVGLMEELLDLLRVALEAIQLVLYYGFAVLGLDLGGGRDERADHNIEDSEEHEEYVEEEDLLVKPMDLAKGLHRVHPVDAAGDDHEQSDHGLAHASPIELQLQGDIILAHTPDRSKVFGDAVHEENCIHVDDEADDDETPIQRHHRFKDTEDDHAEARALADCMSHAKQADEANNA